MIDEAFEEGDSKRTEALTIVTDMERRVFLWSSFSCVATYCVQPAAIIHTTFVCWSAWVEVRAARVCDLVRS